MICSTVALALAAQAVSSGLMLAPATSARAAAPATIGAVVPQGQTYVLFNEKGTKIATYAAGAEPTILARSKGGTTTDCAQIPCPETFKPGTICWKCKQRPASRL